MDNLPERWKPTLLQVHSHPYSVVYAMAVEIGAAEARIAELKEEAETIKQLEAATLPCGHTYRNAKVVDGGKRSYCIVCEQAVTIYERDKTITCLAEELKAAQVEVQRLKGRVETLEGTRRQAAASAQNYAIEAGQAQGLLKRKMEECAEQAATIERLRRELREKEPRVFPLSCFLCEKQIASPDDYEWHGLGNCVPLCEACNGNGFIDAALNPPQPSGATFWVIERFDEGRSGGYWFGNSSRDFSTDIERAIQFRRARDASQVMLSWRWKDTQVTEHKYADTPQPQPCDFTSESMLQPKEKP